MMAECMRVILVALSGYTGCCCNRLALAESGEASCIKGLLEGPGCRERAGGRRSRATEAGTEGPLQRARGSAP
jgi:hypothetical protein